MHTPSNFVAGQTSNYIDQWKTITSDPWVIENVKGIVIPFVEEPVQSSVPFPYKLSAQEKLTVDTEVESMLLKGVIEEAVSETGEWISNIFVVPKPDGSGRIILDLTQLNKLVEYQHFKMESLNTAKELLHLDAFMASVDLKDAYYSFKIREQDRKYLKFYWNDRFYQYTVLPNGLSCAPRVFTKLLAPVFAKIRESGGEAFYYIDDSFIMGSTSSACQETVRSLTVLLDSLGLVVHPDKSVLEPKQKLKFLGFWLDSTTMQVSVSDSKIEKLETEALKLLNTNRPTIRQVAGVVGLMVSCTPGIEYGFAHIKSLEREKNAALASQGFSYDAKMWISDTAKEDVFWWLAHIDCSVKKIRPDDPDFIIETDASLEGWGAYFGTHSSGGRWRRKEVKHINVMELMAILFALKCLRNVYDSHIHIRTDNTTALNYVRKMGGLRSITCDSVARKIWQWAESRSNWITVSYIQGRLNVRADKASRVFKDNLEWSLHDRIFRRICRVFGKPKIDLFASRLNKKCPVYCSWKPDPEADFVDAFSLHWGGLQAYAFPPFSLVLRVINKALRDKPKNLILVTPNWNTRPWFTRLQRVARRQIKFSPNRSNLIPAGDQINSDSIRVMAKAGLIISNL